MPPGAHRGAGQPDREGYLVAPLNYRLAPAATFPAYGEDVAAGIAWVHEHIADCGGDPDRLVRIGPPPVPISSP